MANSPFMQDMRTDLARQYNTQGALNSGSMGSDGGPPQDNPYYGVPGFNQLAQAGSQQKALNTGLDKRQEVAWLLGQQQLAQLQNDPGYQQMLQTNQQQINALQGGMNPALAWMQGQAGQGQQAQDAGLGGLQSAMAQLQALQNPANFAASNAGIGALQGALGQSAVGALNPQMQALVDQQRNLAIQRSQMASTQNLDSDTSRLYAAMAGRGLDASSVASRGQADILRNSSAQAEQGRLAAEQGSIQQEMGLRSLLQNQIGQQMQGGATLAQAGLLPMQQLQSLAQLQGGLGLQGAQFGAGLNAAYGQPAQMQSQLAMLDMLKNAQMSPAQNLFQMQQQQLQRSLGTQPDTEPSTGEKIAGYTLGGINAAGGLASGIGSFFGKGS